MTGAFTEYDDAILTVEGSTVANHLLRELMAALGMSDHARPETPRAVWEEALVEVARLSTDLAHWRQAAIDLGGHLELVRATLDAVIHETTRDVQ